MIWNRFFCIHRSFLTTLEGFLRRLEVPLLNTAKNVSLPALKLFLWHSPFFFSNFKGFFVLIGGTVAKILAKTCVSQIWNWIYGIRRFFLSTFVEVFPLIGGTIAMIWPKACHCCLGNWIYTIHRSFFNTLEAFFVDRKYRWQDTGKNVCSPALKLVLRHLSFIFLHFEYYFTTIGGTVAKILVKTCLPALKLVLRHSPSFF